MASGAAAAYVSQALFSVMSGALSELYGLLAIAITSISDFQLVINHHAAVNLKKAAEKRIEIGKALEIDLAIMREFLKIVEHLYETSQDKKSTVRLKRVHQLLEKSALKLGLEIGKSLQSSGYTVNKSNIEFCVNSLTEAMDILSFGSFSQSESLLNDLVKKLLNDEETATLGRGESINKALYREIKNIQKLGRGSEVTEVAVAKYLRTLETLRNDIFPVIPDVLKLAIMQEILGKSIERLSEKIPMLLGRAEK